MHKELRMRMAQWAECSPGMHKALGMTCVLHESGVAVYTCNLAFSRDRRIQEFQVIFSYTTASGGGGEKHPPHNIYLLGKKS